MRSRAVASQGVDVKQIKRKRALCQHRWVIETPHGATSRGVCKRCGVAKRFPNAAEDAMWASGGLGRWSSRRGVARPTEVKRPREGGKT